MADESSSVQPVRSNASFFVRGDDVASYECMHRLATSKSSDEGHLHLHVSDIAFNSLSGENVQIAFSRIYKVWSMDKRMVEGELKDTVIVISCDAPKEKHLFHGFIDPADILDRIQRRRLAAEQRRSMKNNAPSSFSVPSLQTKSFVQPHQHQQRRQRSNNKFIASSGVRSTRPTMTTKPKQQPNLDDTITSTNGALETTNSSLSLSLAESPGASSGAFPEEDPDVALHNAKMCPQTPAEWFSDVPTMKKSTAIPAQHLPLDVNALSVLKKGVQDDGFLRQYHAKCGDTDLMIGEISSATDGMTSGSRYLSSTTTVYAPFKTVTGLTQGQRFGCGTRDGCQVLYWQLSSQIPKVPTGSAFRSEVLIEVTTPTSSTPQPQQQLSTITVYMNVLYVTSLNGFLKGRVESNTKSAVPKSYRDFVQILGSMCVADNNNNNGSGSLSATKFELVSPSRSSTGSAMARRNSKKGPSPNKPTKQQPNQPIAALNEINPTTFTENQQQDGALPWEVYVVAVFAFVALFIFSFVAPSNSVANIDNDEFINNIIASNYPSPSLGFSTLH
eukprot:PhM_4_TR9770/c0_g1_i2/m.47722